MPTNLPLSLLVSVLSRITAWPPTSIDTKSILNNSRLHHHHHHPLTSGPHPGSVAKGNADGFWSVRSSSSCVASLKYDEPRTSRIVVASGRPPSQSDLFTTFANPTTCLSRVVLVGFECVSIPWRVRKKILSCPGVVGMRMGGIVARRSVGRSVDCQAQEDSHLVVVRCFSVMEWDGMRVQNCNNMHFQHKSVEMKEVRFFVLMMPLPNKQKFVFNKWCKRNQMKWKDRLKEKIVYNYSKKIEMGIVS